MPSMMPPPVPSSHDNHSQPSNEKKSSAPDVHPLAVSKPDTLASGCWAAHNATEASTESQDKHQVATGNRNIQLANDSELQEHACLQQN